MSDTEYLRGAIGKIVFEETNPRSAQVFTWDGLSKEGREHYRSIADKILAKLERATEKLACQSLNQPRQGTPPCARSDETEAEGRTPMQSQTPPQPPLGHLTEPSVQQPEAADGLRTRLEALRAWATGLNAEAPAIRNQAAILINDTLAALARSGEATGAADSTAARDVLAERRRQVEIEGWTQEHDDEHCDGGMAIAAACYALVGSRRALEVHTVKIDQLWAWTGWSEQWFKPKDERSNLVRAGALILAEIERLDRATGAAGDEHAKGTAHEPQ